MFTGMPSEDCNCYCITAVLKENIFSFIFKGGNKRRGDRDRELAQACSAGKSTGSTRGGSLNSKLYMSGPERGYHSAINHCFRRNPSPGQCKRRTETGENLEVKKKIKEKDASVD